MKTSNISVCVPTYNGSKYVEEQLKSILAQLGPADEVIVSDDGSTDGTLDIVRGLNDDRIKIFSHPKGPNPFRSTYKTIYAVYKNVEYALRHASGEYIFLSDQDDIWLPNKVERVMQEFQRGVECVLHNNTVIDNQKQTLVDSYFSISKPSRNLVRFLTFCFYQGASMAFSRKILDLALPFPDNNPLSHDHWIACVAWTHGKKVSFVQEPLLLYRRHGDNVSPSAEKSTNSLYFKISYRFNLLRAYWMAAMR